MKACVVYLVKSDDDYVEDFKNSLNSLYKNFLDKYGYDVLVFVENSFKKYEELFNNYKNLQLIYIEFKNPDYDFPEFYPHPTHGNGPVAKGHPGFDIGYRHMCNFFSGDMYNQEVLKGYNYYWRLDSDSIITGPITYDIFKFCKERSIVYGFVKVEHDNPKVVEGLWEISSKYFNKQVRGYLNMFYTNFEIGNIDWFLTSGYMDYYNYLVKEKGIYQKRWGDAPIKYIGVTMLANNNQLHYFSDIGYRHGTYKPNVEKMMTYIK